MFASSIPGVSRPGQAHRMPGITAGFALPLVTSQALHDEVVFQDSASAPFPQPQAPTVVNAVATVATFGAAALRRRRRQRAAARLKETVAASGRAVASAPAQVEVDEEEEEAALEADRESLENAWGEAGISADLPEERCRELTAQLEEGGGARDAALAALEGSVVAFSLEPRACRVVQAALLAAERGQATALVAELQGQVRRCIASQHGNFVIQKVVEVMPQSHVEFVARELLGAGAVTACGRFGCRVLCRLLEHHAETTAGGPVGALLAEVLGCAADICRHAYGHHVVECAIEHGSPEQRHLIATALQVHLVRNAKNRYSSYVLRRALACSGTEDQEALARGILGNPEQLLSMAESQYGCFVVRAALQLPTEHTRDALVRLQGLPLSSKASKKAQRVLQELRVAAGPA